ncbi:MAG: proton-conducting transporter membrane subunit [Humidesulfovibrio sp.]|uniref:proton-conducting transporter transmembrane domain-containing protein n=1 Tax=Humidesulfovibrio sp. TaxID=2910988 RepID=UPI0027352F64|nr:proton-conducting transporter membrane subunit [Humidesulfovibrio sp.]MDP2847561.1 proton-conducting transporter membrane subunit [Humidesulfovibrio sp.]
MLGALTILVPALAGAAAFMLREHRARRALLVGAAVAHLLLTLAAFAAPARPMFDGALLLDEPGRLFLLITSVLFLAAAFYSAGYLEREMRGSRPDMIEGRLFSNSPEARFTGCLLLFLAAMSFVCMARNLGLLWVGVEATTLASAPLIYFHRHHRSLEATWKYLLLCSVGIALALFGTYMLALAGGGEISLNLNALMAAGPTLDPVLLKAAFVFLLVGYGTKMGLAPMHTWLPDVYSESPSVMALMSTCLLNVSFLAILRVRQVLAAAGQAQFGNDLLVFLGLTSMAWAAVFLLRQTDYKRLLAYSSVEHMGILAFGAGIGGAGMHGSLMHVLAHGAAKGAMFLLAGNVLAAYMTKNVSEVRGAVRALPFSGPLWVAGVLALTGMPPFGLFVSELAILRAALAGDRPFLAVIFLVLLAMAFIGITTAALRMAQGENTIPARPEPMSATWPPLALLLAALLLGLYQPAPLAAVLAASARLTGGF